MNSLFSNILSASFHGGIVIAVVLVLRLVLKKAPKKYICLMWLLAGLRLLMPFEIESRLSLQPETALVTQAQWEQAQIFQPAPEMEESPAVPAQDEPVFPEQQPARNTGASRTEVQVQPVSDGGQTDILPESNAASEPAAAGDFDWTTLVPYLWLAAALSFGVYSLISYLRLKRSVREAVKTADGAWEREGLETAFILGFVRPRIYLPMGLDREERRHILAHERAHLKRGDHWFKLAGFVTLAIHWFNPLVWMAYVLMCKDIEMACDEHVVKNMSLTERKRYSAALLSCSANHVHFAACPVAFGEVSVKQRIFSVLNYRKPGFWVSLVSIAAIVFVALCLLTTPATAGEPPAGEDSAASVPETEQTPVVTDADALIRRCSEAVEELLSRDSYYMQTAITWDNSDNTYVEHRRKSGENELTELFLGDAVTTGGHVLCDGTYATFMGDKYELMDVDRTISQYYMELYFSPEGKTVTFPEGTGAIGDNAVRLSAQWEEEGEAYEGTLTYTFREDGTLAGVDVDAVRKTEEKTRPVTRVMTVQEEDGADTAARIREAAECALTGETPEAYRETKQELQTAAEHPSNKTDYDKQFSLGSEQAGWEFMGGAWFVKFGAVDVTDTGLRLSFVNNGPGDGDNAALSGTVTAGGNYFIERFVDGKWEDVPLAAETFTPMDEKKVAVGVDISVNWERNYGKLPGGFYRIGNYYTFTSAAGETDTQLCYAKFRLYDPDMDALLSKCRTALDSLLNGNSYHIYSFDYMTQYDYDYCLSSEVWKSGRDYLEVTRYPLREDTTQMKSLRGSMWRDGKYYGLEWSGEPVTSDVSSWWVGVDGYLDDSNFELWTMGLEWFDSSVAEVWQDGDGIHILEIYDFDDQYRYTERTCRFDSRGNLTGIVKAYLPSRNCGEQEKVIDEEMVVRDTPAAEIADLIRSQDVSQPMAFSYAEDVKRRPDAATSGFYNTTAKPVKSIADAVALADRECTLDILLENYRYFQVKTCYDAGAKMWKVELFWGQDNSRYQAVYLNDQGITQRIVTTTWDS